MGYESDDYKTNRFNKFDDKCELKNTKILNRNQELLQHSIVLRV